MPVFTVNYVDNSTNVSPALGTDSYTGLPIIVPSGEHEDNRIIVITVRNQPFTSVNDSNMYYNVRVKGHFDQDWS